MKSLLALLSLALVALLASLGWYLGAVVHWVLAP